MLKNVIVLGDDTTDILDGVELRVVESASKVSNMVVKARSLRCSWSMASSVGFDYWFSGVVGRQAIVGLSLEGFRRLREVERVLGMSTDSWTVVKVAARVARTLFGTSATTG